MRGFFLFLAGTGLAVVGMAQEFPYQHTAPSTAPTEIAPMNQESTQLPSIDISSTETNAAENTVSTNQVQDSRTTFLMDVGIEYADEGEYAEAEKAYLRALANDPGNDTIQFRLSTLYIQMGRYKEAADMLMKLEAAFPESPIIQNNLAWIYATGGEMKNSQLALRHAREALLSAPFSPSMWNTLAEAYYVSGEYDEALHASVMAFDLLNSQATRPTDQETASFMNQQAKINRAAEAFKVLEGKDGAE